MTSKHQQPSQDSNLNDLEAELPKVDLSDWDTTPWELGDNEDYFGLVEETLTSPGQDEIDTTTNTPHGLPSSNIQSRAYSPHPDLHVFGPMPMAYTNCTKYMIVQREFNAL